jgi:hypothetical protein
MRELLIIAGNASPDTMATADWITNPGVQRNWYGVCAAPQMRCRIISSW